MKNFILSVFTLLSVLSGAHHIAVAANNNDNLKVRFRENTLVVSAPTMTEARLYTEDGKILVREEGSLVEFELTQGKYLLFVTIDGKHIGQRVELR